MLRDRKLFLWGTKGRPFRQGANKPSRCDKWHDDNLHLEKVGRENIQYSAITGFILPPHFKILNLINVYSICKTCFTMHNVTKNVLLPAWPLTHTPASLSVSLLAALPVCLPVCLTASLVAGLSACFLGNIRWMKWILSVKSFLCFIVLELELERAWYVGMATVALWQPLLLQFVVATFPGEEAYEVSHWGYILSWSWHVWATVCYSLLWYSLLCYTLLACLSFSVLDSLTSMLILDTITETHTRAAVA